MVSELKCLFVVQAALGMSDLWAADILSNENIFPQTIVLNQDASFIFSPPHGTPVASLKQLSSWFSPRRLPCPVALSFLSSSWPFC